MDLLAKLNFYAPQAIAAIVLIFLLIVDIKNRNLSLKQVKISTLIVVLVKLLQFIATIFLFYWQLKTSSDPISAYLLPGKGSNYFWLQAWQSGQVLLSNIALGLLVTLILLYFAKLTRKPWFGKSDYWLIFLVIFLVGLTGIFFVLIGSLVLMVLLQLINILRKKSSFTNRLKLTPFLILACLIHLVLLNFNFYLNFLAMLRLI